MAIQRFIPAGEMLPRGYGVAWWRWELDSAVVLPIPINVIAGWLHRVWFWLMRGLPPSALEARLIAEYRRGEHDRTELMRAEYERWQREAETAYARGWNACLDNLLADLRPGRNI